MMIIRILKAFEMLQNDAWVHENGEYGISECISESLVFINVVPHFIQQLGHSSCDI
jgi:hypothetical protein